MNDRREIFGWSMYDWANSAFSTTVLTVFLPVYLAGVIESVEGSGKFLFLGFIEMTAAGFFPFCVSLSVLMQVFFLPILGAIADYSHLKRRMLTLFAILGVMATLLMLFVEGGTYALGGLLLIVGNLSFGASIVFYNAFLPQMVTKDQRDRVSSFGWAMGYAGGGLLLLLNLIFLQAVAPALKIGRGDAARLCIASAGVWWLVFGFFAIRRIRERGAERALPPGESYLSIGFKQLAHTLREIRKYPMTLRYLLAYLIYNDGIQTVIIVAALFGAQELGMEVSELTLVILMVQVVAFIGALGFGGIAARFGTKQTIIGSLVVWSAVSVWAQLGLRSVAEFWVLAVVVALVLGGSQALSRSLFSLMIPKEKEAEFFSFYEISDRGTSWVGPALFTWVQVQTDSMRTAIFSLIVLFVGGLLLLITVDVRRAIRESGNEGEDQAVELAAAVA